MPINIYTVQEDVETVGWKLISDQYKNLKTPMVFQCPKGHLVELTYEEWRKHKKCPECEKQDTKGIVRNKIMPRAASGYRVVALDAATGITGYAVYDDGKLTSYGTFSTNPNLSSTERINQVKHWLIDCLKIWKPDAIGVENIQLQKNVKMFQTLANLQGVLLDTIYEYHSGKSTLTSSATWRSYCGINDGGERTEAKRAAQNRVRMIYNTISPTQDEADAICFGQYLANRFKPDLKKTITWGEDIL